MKTRIKLKAHNDLPENPIIPFPHWHARTGRGGGLLILLAKEAAEKQDVISDKDFNICSEDRVYGYYVRMMRDVLGSYSKRRFRVILLRLNKGLT
jgi:hypothetical protein